MESDPPLQGQGHSIRIGVAPSTTSTPEAAMYYLGIDVHKDDSQVSVLDENGELVAEQRLENTQFDELAQAYAGSKATLEATGNYFAIYDALDQHLDVAVADPRQTKAIGTAEVKNDRLDAKLLAQLSRADMVAESYVPAKDI